MTCDCRCCTAEVVLATEFRLLALFLRICISSADDRVVLAELVDNGRAKNPLPVGEASCTLGGLELDGD